jgi:hypothetical protein
MVFQALPTKSLVVKGEKCPRGKMCKGRKAAKPRCFKNPKINNLPVMWRNNKKAWMTAATMEEWLNMFNAKMKKENRNDIFFLTMPPATQR